MNVYILKPRIIVSMTLRYEPRHCKTGPKPTSYLTATATTAGPRVGVGVTGQWGVVIYSLRLHAVHTRHVTDHNHGHGGGHCRP